MKRIVEEEVAPAVVKSTINAPQAHSAATEPAPLTEQAIAEAMTALAEEEKPVVIGNPGRLKTLCTQDFYGRLDALEIPSHGCVLLGHGACFVPGAKLSPDINGGFKLVKI